ncbi:putative branched-subunit amino acid permease [Sediminihabitans luteus]|uniref:Putative branched-subunit amino acid permease n=1 Tax=Sediminihabitans luteus TaxID=1138585 RepID=A0A2M9CCE7_9CELL|nr:AzlC family ABC transporter permease [Sediminihabitans luteus]PJJ69028.1 putative branched-subunit amino acid permease [Sediminihabitans luteus]GII99414.1 branched-chain amino acid ABC transporter permease [Sediminihabitans luteus]
MTDDGSPPPDPGVRDAVRQALSVSFATGLYGVSFGALSTVAGLSLAQTAVLSLLMFSGGSQFALVGVVGGGGAPVSAILSASFLGVRNALYGIRLGPLLALHGWRRVLAAHLTIDESTAVATAQSTRRAARAGFWWTGVGVFVLWNAFVLAGALAGDALADPGRWGLDAAAAAAFLGLLWPRLSTREVRLVVLAAGTLALVLVPLAPPGVPVLAAAALAVVISRTPAGRRPAADDAGPGVAA